MPEPTVGAGRVPITLDGKPFELVPSLEACIEISNIAGGINVAVQRCAAFNFSTICDIVGAGLQVNGKRLNPGQREKFIPKAVYEAGLIGVSAACIEFCHMVANGGRLPEPEGEQEDEEEEESPLGSPTSSSTSDSSSA